MDESGSAGVQPRWGDPWLWGCLIFGGFILQRRVLVVGAYRSALDAARRVPWLSRLMCCSYSFNAQETQNLSEAHSWLAHQNSVWACLAFRQVRVLGQHQVGLQKVVR